MKHLLQLHLHGEKAFMFPDTLFSQVTYKKWYNSVNVPGDRKKSKKKLKILYSHKPVH